MKTRKTILILCMIITFLPILNLSPVESQWFNINISYSPYMQPYADSYASFSYAPSLPFWGRMSSSQDINPFLYALSMSQDTAVEMPASMPLASIGQAAAIANGYLVTCRGEQVMDTKSNEPASQYILETIDLTGPDGYKEAGKLTFESESAYSGQGKVKKVCIDQNVAYILINDPAGIYVVDLSNIETPELVAYHDLDFVIAEDMEIRKGWAFVCFNDYDSIIASIYVGNPQEIDLIDSIILDGWIQDIHLDQEILLALGDNTCGLNIIDCSDPRELEIIDHMDLRGQAVWMSGGGILTAGGDLNQMSRLTVVDFREFDKPSYVASLNLLGMERAVCSHDGIVYCLSTSDLTDISRVYIFSMNTETLKPELSKIVKIEGVCETLMVYPPYLMAYQGDTILLWDISEPETPKALEAFQWEVPSLQDILLNPKDEAGKNGDENKDEQSGSLPNWGFYSPYGKGFSSGPFSSYYNYSEGPGSDWPGFGFQGQGWNNASSPSFGNSWGYQGMNTWDYDKGYQFSLGNQGSFSLAGASPLIDLFSAILDLSVNGMGYSL